MIKILGGGIAGLTAAINLIDKHGVVVYERQPAVGMRFKPNGQMLFNLDSKEDILSSLQKYNIEIEGTTTLEQIEIYSPDLKHKAEIHSDERPIGYTVIRGGEESFECRLAKQAEKKGVRIVANFRGRTEADIIATGPKSPELGLGYGAVLSGRFDRKKAVILFDYDLAPGGYVYLLPHSESTATIALAMRTWTHPRIQFHKLTDHPLFRNCFRSSDVLYHFSGLASGTIKKIPKTAKSGNSLIVGEAMGFQDNVFGFGMKYAIISGHLAARSIAEGLDYDRLWKVAFSREFKKTRVMRIVLDRMNNRFLNKFVSEIGIKRMGELSDLWMSKKNLFFFTMKSLLLN